MGVEPVFAASFSVRLTETVVSLVACTGGGGTVVIEPTGGATSMTIAGPEGAPLNTLPARSCPATRKVTGPEGVNAPTFNVPCQVLRALLLTVNAIGPLP